MLRAIHKCPPNIALGSDHSAALRPAKKSCFQTPALSTDDGGNYVSNAIGGVPGGSLALETMESRFGQDLNGDGTTGIVSTLIESAGSAKLMQVADGYALYPAGSGSGPALKYGGMLYEAGQFGAWTPIGAEATAGGYQVAWKLGSTEMYTVWNTDGGGNYVSNAIGGVSGGSLALETMESRFGQDLNGDGTIGVVTTVAKAIGGTELVKLADTYALYPTGGSAGPALKYGGMLYMAGEFGAWTPIGAEATADGYQVAWKLGSTQMYTVWNTDDGGNYVSNAIGGVPGGSAELKAFESAFHRDLNGDGSIASAGASLLAHNGWHL